MSRLPALALGLSIVLVVGCAPPVEPRFSESASSGTRPAWTREDLDAVVTYAEEDGHGPVQDTSISRHGVVVVFAETVISYGVDPVRRVWRHDLPGEVVATALSPGGDVLLVRHRDDIGPFGRERLLLVDTERGRVSVPETVDALEETAQVRLADESTQVTLAAGLVEVSTPPFKEPDWTVDLDETCEEGRAREIALLSHTSTVLSAHGCEGEDAAHVRALRTENGTAFWEQRWEGAEPPRLHSLSSEQVTGVDGDLLTLLFGEGTTGDSLFIDARTGSIAAEVAPWSQVPELSSHLEAPLQDAEAAPKEIVLFDPLPREGRGRLYLAAARALVDDEQSPVALEDLDESLLIDGELMEHLGQWGDSPDLMFGRLENSLNEALG